MEFDTEDQVLFLRCFLVSADLDNAGSGGNGACGHFVENHSIFTEFTEDLEFKIDVKGL